MTGSQDERDGQRPKVSVCVVTYNQRDYIGECLESIVTQQTDFPFEVIVGDDASTDGTTDIVRDYAERYPNLIRPVFHENNVGPFENYRVVHRMARGEYVAHIDGDDAMLPGKLVKQAALLDENPALSAAFHQLKMVNSDGKDTKRLWPVSAPEIFDIEFILKKHPIFGHSSMMYRFGSIEYILHGSGKFIDFKVYIALSAIGNVGYIDECLGIYTIGIGISNKDKWLPQVMECIDFAETLRVSQSAIKFSRSNHLFRAALNDFYEKNYSEFQKNVNISIKYGIISWTQIIFYSFRMFPKILKIISDMYLFLKRKNIVKDIKMSFRKSFI